MPALALLAALALGPAACAPETPPRPTAGVSSDSILAFPVEWLADSARAAPLAVEPPPGVWITRVAPARAAPPEPTLPEPMPGVPDEAPPPVLDIEPGLVPPIPRRIVCAPAPHASRRAHVELDVRVGEDGRVTDVVWAAGADDRELVDAAMDCARAMTFYPALRGDRPVAVWCRQRFDFGR